MTIANAFYEADLAYVHDAGFGRCAEGAAPLVLDALRRGGIERGLIIDLGCGSGIASRRFHHAGFEVLGIDLSESMLALARKRVPGMEFRFGSFVDLTFSSCVAVVAIGEIFNYVADARNDASARSMVFSRIHDALASDGVFLFDLAGPDRAPQAGPRQAFFQSEDWAVLVETEGDRSNRLLTRRITTFRRSGELFRRSDETHVLELLEPSQVHGELIGAGFSVQMLDAYGKTALPEGLHAYFATKPSTKAGK